MVRTDFKDINALFESKGCKLLTTKVEYDGNNMNKQDKYRYIAKCGHEHEVYCTGSS